MRPFGRHHDPPVAQISISDPGPVSEIRVLRRLGEVVQILAVQVGGQRLTWRYCVASPSSRAITRTSSRACGPFGGRRG